MKSSISTVRNAIAKVSRNFYILQDNGDFIWWADDSSWNPFSDIENSVARAVDAHNDENYLTTTLHWKPEPNRRRVIRRMRNNVDNKAKEKKVPSNIWSIVKAERELKEKMERMLNIKVTFVSKGTMEK